jgi:type I restriction-modification system specificity subunit
MYNCVKLGTLTRIRTGKLDANASSTDGTYPFFTCSREVLRIATYSYDCECVLVAGNGDLNVKYYAGKFDAYQRTYIIESIDKSKLLTKYLYFFLDIYVEVLRTQSIGGVIKYIKLGNLADALIPLPGIEKQAEIVDCLETCNVIIDRIQQQLTKLDELVKSRFVEMFGDPVSNPHGFEQVALSQLAEIKIGPFGSLLHKEDYIEGGHPLLNPSHISEGRIVPDDKLTVSDSKYAEMEAYHLHTGDIVMGRRGEMGRCAVVPDEGYLCGTGSLLIRTKGEVTADYLQKVISFPTFKKIIEDMAVGQTMPNLNVPIVSSFQIIKPPIDVQRRYYAFVAEVDKSKLAVKQSLEKLETLKKSLMQEYFG